MLSNILEFDFGEDHTQNEAVWLVMLHLSSIICILIIPLLIWSWKKTQSYKIDKQGRQVLNFQITMILVLFAGGCLLMLVPAMIAILGESGIAACTIPPGAAMVECMRPAAVGTDRDILHFRRSGQRHAGVSG